MNKSNYRSGVTLLELLITISILLVVAGALAIVFRYSYRTYALETTDGQLQLEGQVILDRINRQTRQAIKVTNAWTTHTTNEQILILQLASLTGGREIIPNTYDYIIYRPDSANPNHLLEITLADSASSRQSGTRTLTKHLATLAFRYFDSAGTELSDSFETTQRLTLAFQLTEERFNHPRTADYTQTITLRNQ